MAAHQHPSSTVPAQHDAVRCICAEAGCVKAMHVCSPRASPKDGCVRGDCCCPLVCACPAGMGRARPVFGLLPMHAFRTGTLACCVSNTVANHSCLDMTVCMNYCGPVLSVGMMLCSGAACHCMLLRTFEGECMGSHAIIQPRCTFPSHIYMLERLKHILPPSSVCCAVCMHAWASIHLSRRAVRTMGAAPQGSWHVSCLLSHT